jgi:hypothetical protein
MIVVALMAVFLIAFSIAYAGETANGFYFAEGMAARTAADSIALGANAAFIAGNGSQAPFSISNANQTATIVGSFAQVSRSNALAQSKILTSRIQVTGNLSEGDKTVYNNEENLTIG